VAELDEGKGDHVSDQRVEPKKAEMTADQHEAKAVELIQRMSEFPNAEAAMILIATAQVHATLALSKRVAKINPKTT
jgi:hypothetical protein